MISGANTVRQVEEAEFVRAVAAWLEGADWRLSNARFAPYRGISIRLRPEGDTLAMGGVPIISRSPPQLLRLPLDKPAGATARSEARALCAVALRGDADRLYGKPSSPAQDGLLAAA